MIEPNLLMPQNAPAQIPSMTPAQPQITPQQIDTYHTHLDDMQNALKELIRMPDEDLNLSKIYGKASDLITENRMSGGKRGPTAMEVASELSGPDFPREVDGKKPSASDIRKYLVHHFDKYAAMQAAVTSKFAPPSQQGVVNAAT